MKNTSKEEKVAREAATAAHKAADWIYVIHGTGKGRMWKRKEWEASKR